MQLERGQTGIAYSILVFVVLIIIGAVYYFNKGFLRVGTPQEKNLEYQVDYVEDVPIDNCSGDNQIDYEDEREYVEEHLITVEGKGISSLDIHFISQKIELQYSVQDKETLRHRKNLHFSAAPGEKIVYHIKWTYLWKKGDGVVLYPDGTEKMYDFSVRTQLIPVVSTEKFPCSP